MVGEQEALRRRQVQRPSRQEEEVVALQARLELIQEKTEQAMRIRKKLVQRRNQALKALLRNVDSEVLREGVYHSDYPHAVGPLGQNIDAPLETLRQCLAREKKVMLIVSSHLEEVLEDLALLKKELHEAGAGKEVLRSLDRLKSALAFVKRELPSIEKRMTEEEKFLRNPTPMNLLYFFSFWKKEMREEGRIVLGLGVDEVERAKATLQRMLRRGLIGGAVGTYVGSVGGQFSTVALGCAFALFGIFHALVELVDPLSAAELVEIEAELKKKTKRKWFWER